MAEDCQGLDQCDLPVHVSRTIVSTGSMPTKRESHASRMEFLQRLCLVKEERGSAADSRGSTSPSRPTRERLVFQTIRDGHHHIEPVRPET